MGIIAFILGGLGLIAVGLLALGFLGGVAFVSGNEAIANKLYGEKK